MNSIEEYKKLPDLVKIAYAMELEVAMPGLADRLKARPGAYETACLNWVDKSTTKVIEGGNQ